MTTAHRPTFHAAIGGKEQGGGRYVAGVTRVHVHDLASQTSIKKRYAKAGRRCALAQHRRLTLPRPHRMPGQGTQAEVRAKNLRAELEQRELDHLKAIGKAPATKPPPPVPPPEEDEEDEAGVGLIIDPEDADDRHVLTAAPAADGSEEESDDEDETEELMRELERIKKERAAEAAKREREAAETEAREADSAILQGNPLLDPTRLGAAAGGAATFSVKRRCE
jgi:protein CWC15